MRRGTNIDHVDDQIGCRDIDWLVPFFKTTIGQQRDKEQFRRELHEVMSAATALRERDQKRRAEIAAAAALERAELPRAIAEIARAAKALRKSSRKMRSAPLSLLTPEAKRDYRRRRLMMWLAVSGLWSAVAVAIAGLGAVFAIAMR